jgi:hypothetical protein
MKPNVDIVDQESYQVTLRYILWLKRIIILSGEPNEHKAISSLTNLGVSVNS